MFNSSIWETFKRFKIYQNNKEIEFTVLEEQILNYISNEEKGNYLFIAPKDNDYFLLVSIIYSALKMSYYNIFQGGNDILDLIEVGDMLQYNKLLCRLIDKDDKNLVLQFKDGKSILPLNLRYKLNKYNGDATVLNKMQTKSMKSTKKTKNLLAEIMDINIDEMFNVSKKSLLIIENKQRINELIKSIDIKIGDNPKVALTEVFAMAYYSSVDNVYHYKGNTNKGEPIVKFTSKIYIANELCKKMKDINSILFLPKKISNEDLSDLKEIERKKNINKVSSVISPIELERHIGNEYLHEDFLVRDLSIDINSIIETKSFNERQLDYYKNYINKNIKVNVVKYKDVNKLRKDINKVCSILSKTFINDEDILKYVISVRKITKRLVSVPIPLIKYDEMIESQYPSETIKILIIELKKSYDELLNRNISLENKECISKIYDSVQKLYSLIIEDNPKWSELKTIISLTKSESILIVNDNKIVRFAIKGYLNKLFPWKKNIVVGNRDTKSNCQGYFDKTIFTGLLEDNMYNNYAKYNTKSVICIFYQFEKKFFEYLRNKYNSFIDNIKIEESIGDNENINIEDDIYIDEDIEKELKLEVELEELITIGYIPNVGINYDGSQSTNKCCKVVKFTDGKKAFITKQFNAYELDEDREEILIRKPSELIPGQVLLFVNDIERDIVESTIKDLLAIKKIRDVYEVAYGYSKEWKNILKNYMDVNNYSYNELERQLRKYGVKRTNATIRSWVVDSIVGPQEEEIYEVLAQMTRDKYFLENYNEIYKSCNMIRSFQIKVRKAIAKSLLRVKTRDDNDEIDNIIMDNCSHLFNNVIKVEVAKIHDIEKEIPCYLTNIVLEE